MPELQWKEHELIEFFGVLPETEEYETFHCFKIEKSGFILTFTIWQIESLAALSLSQSGKTKAFLEIWFLIRDQITYINDKRGSFLEFKDFVLVTQETAHMNYLDYFDKTLYPLQRDLKLEIEPEISLSII